MDYMEKVVGIFDIIGENDSLENLMKAKPLISEISEYVKGTPLFQDAKDKYDEYLVSFMSIEDKEKRIRNIWTDFICKINDAPTRMHMRGVVILVLPALNEVMNSN
ncbi:MAG: hypothetical protein PHT07_14860 [Paludibacter sp.]|nr:hypothetical protein [Paludibacter sp.]